MDVDLTPLSSPSASTPDYTTNLEHGVLVLPRPAKRPRDQDDPFFLDGTAEYKASWLKLHAENEKDDSPAEPLTIYHCHQGTCHGQYTLSSLTAYEHHYETNHRYICQSCKKAFPAQKWLDIHLREVHDMFVRIRRERGERTYQCFVEGCDRFCSTSNKRRMHLIDKHRYPRQFNFDIVFSGVIPLSQRIHEANRQQALRASRERHRQQQASSSMDIEPAAPPATKHSVKNRVPSASKYDRNKPRHGNSVGLHPPPHAFRSHRAVPQQSPTPHHAAEQPDETMHSIEDAASSSVLPTTDLDMEMDNLERNMARLMVPRSVAARAAGILKSSK